MVAQPEAIPVSVQLLERPARRLILLRGREATEYWGYCAEVGCEVWEVLSSFQGALYEPMGLWLPDSLRKPGTSLYAQGVELPAGYFGPVPVGYDVVDLPPCAYLLFHAPPFADEEMGRVVGAVSKAIERYQPEQNGWRWADEEAPRFQLAPEPERGYSEGRPVRAL